jgi:metal transporter CNNM
MEYLIVTVLVLLSGAFSGLTLGFFSLNLTSLERKMKLGDPQAQKVYPIRKRGNLLLCTLLLGNVAVNSALSIFLGDIASGLIAGIIATSLIVVFGEIIPQAVFSRFALQLGSKTVWLVRIFIFIFFPVTYPLSWLLDKALGEELGTIWSKKEIEEIIKHHEDAEESEIDEDEERIMLGALAFSEKTVESIATPKPMVFMLEETEIVDEELIRLIKEKGFSRIPVVSEEKEDDILGILFTRDLLGVDLKAEKTVKDYLRREVLFVKETMTLDDLLNHFLSQKRHMSCVFDEFGVFLGVVTLEDILEEILKREIIDEADRANDLRAEAAKLVDKDLLE